LALLGAIGATNAMADTFTAFTAGPGGNPFLSPSDPGYGTGPLNYDPGLPVNLGNVFTANTNLWVTGLGFYNQPSLTGPETVSLYGQSGNLLASTPVSLTGPVVNGYIFQSITPLEISPGTYTVAAQVNNNPWSFGPAPATASGVTFQYNDYAYTSSVAFPTIPNGSGPTYYGPNFQFTPGLAFKPALDPPPDPPLDPALSPAFGAGATGNPFLSPGGPGYGIGPLGYEAGLPVNLGNVFTLKTTKQVVALGFYNQRYLTGPETVALYDQFGNLLSSTSVSLTDPVVNGYIFQSITPLTLPPGTYTVDAQVNSNPWSFGPAPPTAPGVTFQYDDYAYTSALAFPTTRNGSGPAYYGPNFAFAPTPEPPFCGFLALGLTGLIAAVRRRKGV